MVVLSESLLNQRDKIFEIQIKNTLEVVRADSGFISMVQRLRDGDLSEKSFLSTFQKNIFLISGTVLKYQLPYARLLRC